MTDKLFPEPIEYVCTFTHQHGHDFKRKYNTLAKLMDGMDYMALQGHTDVAVETVIQGITGGVTFFTRVDMKFSKIEF